MEMHQIRYFLAVCETLNFTRAAEACNVTQPALTRAVQKLEEELGGLLFRRERNLSHMTDFGRLMRPRLEQVLAQTDEAKATASSFLRLDNAPLSLGVMCTVGATRFVGFLADFQRRHEGIELSVIEGVPGRLSSLLQEGAIDIAVMAQPEPFSERMNVHPLYSERFLVALPAGHRLESRNAIQLADLEGESYLSRINCEYRDHIRQIREQQNVNIRYAFRSERDDWIQALVAAGLGFCIVPETLPRLPGIVARPLLDPEITRQVSLVTISGRRFSPAAGTFIRALKSFRWGEAAVME